MSLLPLSRIARSCQLSGVMEVWNRAATVSTTTYLQIDSTSVAAFYYLIMTSILTVAQAFENRMGQEIRNMTETLIKINLHKL